MDAHSAHLRCAYLLSAVILIFIKIHYFESISDLIMPKLLEINPVIPMDELQFILDN